MAKNIVKWSNVGAQILNQPITLMMTFASGLLLDPVITGGTNILWTAPSGATSTGGTPSPAIDEVGRYKITMDSQSAMTALVADDDTVTCVEINSLMTGLATLTLSNNTGLDVDGIVDQIYALREILPAMTVNIGGTCPDVSALSIPKISTLTGSYGHTWTYNSDAFLFTVKTDNTGTSNNDQFTIPLPGSGTYNFTVYYDGISTVHTANTSLTLTFPSGAGTYDLAILGVFPRIYFNNGGDKLKLTGITQFGDVGWGTDWDGTFYGCSNCISTLPTLPDNILTLFLAFATAGFTGSIPTLPSTLTSLRSAFVLSAGFTGNVPILPSTVINCSASYQSCTGLAGTIGDQSAADGTLATVANMFNGCSNLTGNSEPFWNWTTPPTTTTNCYTNCTSLTDYATIPAAYGGLGEPTASTAAYSVSRRIYSSYSGSIIRVREDGGDTLADIGVDGNGDLDTAALATHCGANNGFIHTIYDQQGSNNASNTALSGQPKIYDSATGVITSNGKPAAYYSTSAQVLKTASGLAIMTAKRHSTFTVSEQVSGSSNVLSAFSTANWSLSMSIGVPTFVLFDGTWRTAASRTLSANVQYIAACIRSGDTTVDSYVNDSEYLANTCGDVSFGATVCGLGRHPTSSGAQVHYNQEWIHYANDETSNQSTTRHNINAYYGAY